VSIPGYVRADTFPSKPVEYVVVFAAGGSTDVISRGLVDIASKELGQAFVILNKPGGGGSVGVSYWASAKPDGYTIGTFTAGAAEIQPHLIKVPYDPLEDIEPIMQLFEYPQGFAVGADSPFKTFRELVEYAKQNPGKVSYGSSGTGGAPHIFTEIVAAKLNIKLTHVPFKGGAPAAAAVLGGHIMGTPCADFVPYVKAKTMRLLVVYNPKRLADFPEAPTLRELGYDLALSNYMGIGAPAGVPKDRLEKLYRVLKNAREDPGFKELLKKWSVEDVFRRGDELAKVIREGYEDRRQIIEKLGLRKSSK
jgi:tripartite-type tricarboxylate transporter receptor subunit TctC